MLIATCTVASFTVIGVFLLLQQKVTQQALSQQKTLKPYTPLPTTAPTRATSVLLIEPEILRVSHGQKGSVSVFIDTGENAISQAQLELSYDPKILTFVTISPGTFIPNPQVLVNSVDTAKGRISFAVEAGLNESPFKGRGSVATLSFQARGPLGLETTITFLPKSMVSNQQSGLSLLKESIGATVRIGT